MSFFRSSQRRLVSGFVLLVGVAAAAQPSEGVTAVWVSEYLEEFSRVIDAGPGNGMETLATHLTIGDERESPSLVYERNLYDSDRDRTPTFRQLIHYPCDFADFDPETLEVVSWEGPRSGKVFWVVTVRTTAEKGYLDYTNVVEERRPNGTVDVTSSRGKARNLALGYFESEEYARRLVESVGQLMAKGSAGTRAGESGPLERHQATRPAQSLS